MGRIGQEDDMANVVLTIGGWYRVLIDEKDAGMVAVALAKAKAIDRESKYADVAKETFEEWHWTRTNAVALETAPDPRAKVWPTEREARLEAARRAEEADSAEQARLDAKAAAAAPDPEVFA
jgi:hypothetical protein